MIQSETECLDGRTAEVSRAILEEGAGPILAVLGRDEVGVIEEVEKLGAEFDAESLGDPSGVDDGEVEASEWGAKEHVPTQRPADSRREPQGGVVKPALRRADRETIVVRALTRSKKPPRRSGQRGGLTVTVSGSSS